MTKREQYSLEFSKMKMAGFSDTFICTGSSYVNGSLQLAVLLETLPAPQSLLTLRNIKK